ncbi:Acyl-CoA synthetase family member 2, mitochondrial [Exaiptasia diaphana]|nr:Acyl-CoA synthetase family member 2, mitochondrial [Exaiptasia diaphana]
MSYIHIPHDRPLEHRTAFQILKTHAKQQPNKEAIVFRDEKLNRVSLTFQEYDTRSSSLAAGLLEIGVGRGDRVLMLLPSHMEFPLFHIALNRIGAVTIACEENSYLAVRDIPNLACVIARVDPTIVNNDKVISEIKKALHQNMLKTAVIVGSDADADLLDHPKVYTHQTLYAMAKSNPQSTENVRNAEATVQMDDPCLVLFSSGTTSLPKPIEFTYHAYVNGIHASINSLELTRDSIFFNALPFNWVPGIMSCVLSCLCGLTFVTFPPKCAISSQHVMSIMRIIQEEAVTDAHFVLPTLQDIACHKEEIIAKNMEKVQYVSTGGQPTPLSLIKTMFSIWPNLNFLNLYGSTEVPIISVQKFTKGSLDSLDYGIMRVIPGLEIKIVNEEGELMPTGGKGEICLRSAWVSFCNWDYMNPDLEGRVDTIKKPNGWHSSKDVGVVVNQNCIRLLGRLDFMIKVATDSIPPALVESTLQQHPDVKKVCVVGVPDERLYQKICACIILKQDHHDNRNDLSEQFDEWGKDKFLKFSIGFMIKPHYYVFLDSFPLTRTGKVNRRGVRDIAIKELRLMQ